MNPELCVTNHTIRGRHDPDCLTMTLPADIAPDCEGCAPAEAKFGPLCGPCFGRIRAKLKQTPQLAAHIRAQVTPSLVGADGPKVSGTKERRLPMREQAVEDADDLFSAITNYMLFFAKTIGRTPPYAALPYREVEAGATKLPPYALDQQGAHRALENLMEWYLKREKEIVTALDPADVKAWYDDLADLTGRLFGRYPQAPRPPRPASPRMCEMCKEHAVRVDFDAYPVKVECASCHWAVPAERVEEFVEWASI